MSDTKNNVIAVAGTDLFADSESFLNELTDSELVQLKGGAGAKVEVQLDPPSGLSLLLCL